MKQTLLCLALLFNQNVTTASDQKVAEELGVFLAIVACYPSLLKTNFVTKTGFVKQVEYGNSREIFSENRRKQQSKKDASVRRR